jgi:hypothetical protein
MIKRFLAVRVFSELSCCKMVHVEVDGCQVTLDRSIYAYLEAGGMEERKERNKGRQQRLEI